MTRWQVELLGEAYDLEELPYFFATGEICCLAEDGTFFLIAQAFEGQQEPSQVHAMQSRSSTTLPAQWLLT